MRPVVIATPMIETTRIVGSKDPISFLWKHFYLEPMLLPISHIGLELVDQDVRFKLLNWPSQQ